MSFSSAEALTKSTVVHDVLGVGFGPSSLALAIAMDEEAVNVHGRELSTLFLERQSGFSWHPNMLLDNTRIQLSFLKDLVTLRNPCSSYSFIKYLHSRHRLDEFINLRQFYPTRKEFNDYYRWAAQQLDDRVRYGSEALAIDAASVSPDGTVETVQVTLRDVETGQIERCYGRHLVLATGGFPKVPPGIDIDACDAAFHSQSFLKNLKENYSDPQAAYSFVIVGSGQTAAEIFVHLYNRYPHAQITAALRRFAYKPADSSHFVNEIFFPRMVDQVYNMPPDKRARLLGQHFDTNYSAVDEELIQEIYEILYAQRVAGEDRVRIRPFLELRELRPEGGGARVVFADTIDGQIHCLDADGVILATGFERPTRHPLLANLDPYLVPAQGAYVVDRSFRLETLPHFRPGIFLQGFTEHTHGLSDTLLSTLPHRSLEILQGMDFTTVKRQSSQTTARLAVS